MRIGEIPQVVREDVRLRKEVRLEFEFIGYSKPLRFTAVAHDEFTWETSSVAFTRKQPLVSTPSELAEISFSRRFST